MMSVVLATSVLLALPVQDDTVSQAQALLAEGNPDAALAALEGAGDSPDVCIARGKAYMAQADAVFNATGGGDDVTNLLQDGRAQFEKAVELAPDEVTPLKELGYVRLYRFGESDAVMDMATQGLEAHPGDGELLLLRGCAGAYVYWNAKQSGDETASQNAWDAAVKDLDESTKVLPRERVEPWGQLLWFYEDAAQGEKAVDAAIAIVDREDEPNYDNLYRLAVNYSYSRDFAASGKALEKIISLSARELTNRLKKSERMDEVATNLAWSIDPFVQRQDRATARAILQAIVSADP